MLRNWIAGAVMALVLGCVTLVAAEDANGDIAMIEKLLSGEPAVVADFQPAFLASVPIAQLNAVLAETLKSVGPPIAIVPREGGYSVATAGYEMFVQISLDSKGKIAGLLLHPPVSTNRDLPAILGDIASAAQRAAYLVIKDGEVVSEHNSDAPLAVGSAFKLAVLAVLNSDIVAGRRAWADVVTIEPQQKSLPSGLLHTFPDGAPMTLYGLAALMISISDNTATDVLLDLVGRDAVARKLGIDFVIKTRELFLLKRDTALRTRFLAADVVGKTAIAAEMDAMPLTLEGVGAVDPLTEGVEWYVPLSTLCRVIAEIAHLDIMQIATGPARRTEWDRVSYKGGSEVGVLNLTTEVKKGDSTYCVAVTFNAPDSLDEIRLLAGLHVQHELRQRPVQARQRAFHDGKARASEFGAQLKVQPQRLADIHMVFGFKSQGCRGAAQASFRAPFTHLDIACFTNAQRHAVMRQIGNGQQQSLQVELNLVQTGAAGFQLGLKRTDLRHHRSGVFAFGLKLADLFGQRVALVLQLFSAGLDGLAFSLQRLKDFYIEEDLRVLAGFQPGNRRGQVFTEQVDVKHGAVYFLKGSVIKPRWPGQGWHRK